MKNIKQLTLLIALALNSLPAVSSAQQNDKNNFWINIMGSLAPIIATHALEFFKPQSTPSNLQHPITQETKTSEHPMFDRARKYNAPLLERRATLERKETKPKLPSLPKRIAEDRARIAENRVKDIQTLEFSILARLAELTHKMKRKQTQ